MKGIDWHRMMMWASMTLLSLLVACTPGEDTLGNGEVPTVDALFTFSLPNSIVGKQSKKDTRMGPEVVQEGSDADSFRGIDDIHLFCFDKYPTQTSSKIGKTIDLNNTKKTELDETTEEDYSLTQQIRIPVGTSYFAFYARAADAPKTHEERMHYGVIETIGLDKSDYTNNSGIRFRPVPICTSSDPLGGSERGRNLLNLLNELVNITGPEAAPNNKWATANNLYLDEGYKVLTSMTTLSSYHVQYVLGFLHKLVNQEPPDEQGVRLAEAITEKIASCCATEPEAGSDEITLKDDYQGFPDDIHLPAGAARIKWNAAQSRFEIQTEQDYGKGLDIQSINDYAYPMNLQYQVFSDISASDSLVIQKDQEDSEDESSSNTPEPQQQETSETAQGTSWKDLIDSVYVGASKTVLESTQSVAMVKQVQYAVGRLALRARIDTGNIYDAHGQLVDVSNGFKLKGYIVGGQQEVDYNFQPVNGSRKYAIYDTDIAEGSQEVRRRYWTEYNYILGLGTLANENIYLALELENNGEAFYGADGLIGHGATFYLVAAMVPSEGSNYAQGSLDHIFNKDYATQVNLTILGGWADVDGDQEPDPDLDDKGNPKPLTGLATATYGMPNMQIPHPVVGVSVDLNWEDGLFYEDIEL